ncbi:MAG: GNAT family N-acetyltransferase [Pseudopedobacter saltans]|uniref:GNAT family N-acetyltransferase n=1 Tax=Pseudopedobacter saltans TaxID=151895 RepID=A0A2W5EL36_9SPHI|nr:MAG: GNAT family N-acetyltransferase [Pseudopedobacter saltans]
MSITIKNSEKDGKGIFEAYEEDKKAGEMTYVKNKSDIIIIDHTEVDPSFGGKGIGKQLVESAVAYARAKHLKIMPLCPFASKVMTGKKQYEDVMM